MRIITKVAYATILTEVKSNYKRRSAVIGQVASRLSEPQLLSNPMTESEPTMRSNPE
ncbi:hypothetical protein ES703_119459 [subsurface metagenome]